MSEEVWADHNSTAEWRNPDLWTTYFTRAEGILGAKFTHLDVSDPLRRRIRSLTDAGAYVCLFRSHDTDRWLFGRLESGIELSIRLYREVTDFPNRLTWHVPMSFLQRDASCSRTRQLFDLGNEMLRPFYSWADELHQMTSKEKSSGTVDIQSELLGVFWLTYFNAAYVTFFGMRKFEALPGTTLNKDGSASLVLADCPMLVPDELREQLAHTLGRQSFVEVHDILGKRPGQHTLTFEQLKQFESSIATSAQNSS